MTTEAAPATLLLTVRTTIAELQPGDIFDYGTRVSRHDFAASPITSITRVSTAQLFPGTAALYRVHREHSGPHDALHFGSEPVFRAVRE